MLHLCHECLTDTRLARPCNSGLGFTWFILWITNVDLCSMSSFNTANLQYVELIFRHTDVESPSQ